MNMSTDMSPPVSVTPTNVCAGTANSTPQAVDALDDAQASNALSLKASSFVTEDAIICDYMDQLIKGWIQHDGALPSPAECTQIAVREINSRLRVENGFREKGAKFPMLKSIPNYVIARMLAARGDLALIAPGIKGSDLDTEPLDNDKLPVAQYHSSGSHAGLWVILNDPVGEFGEIVEQYKPSATTKDKKEIFASVRTKLSVINKCVIPYLVPVGNCIVNVMTKELIPYNPAYVFTSKIRTYIFPKATNPIMYCDDGTPWNVEAWIDEICAGNQDMVLSVWELLQALCTPLAPYHKMVVLYSQSGNNGKGSLCELAREIIGHQNCASISISQFSGSDGFALSTLPNSVAIICDENPVRKFMDDMSNLKAVITGDVVRINEKYRPAYDYAYNGQIVECTNFLPNVLDKTGSFKRRLHIIDFPKSFTGKERKEIKSVFLHMREVRNYVLKKVLLDMPYRDSYTETESSKAMLKSYTLQVNSVEAFCAEVLPECKWSLLPATDFLYPCYVGWYKKTHGGFSGTPVSRNDFIDGVKDFVNNPSNNSEWIWTDCSRAKGRICSDEPLLKEYDVSGFVNDNGYKHPPYITKEKYSGLLRKYYVDCQDEVIVPEP